VWCAPTLPPMPGDSLGLAVIDVNAPINCVAAVHDSSDPTASVSGSVLLDTTAVGGNPGVGDFVLGGVRQTARTGVVCNLAPVANGGSQCSFVYLPTFSGRPDGALLQHHDLHATYAPDAASNLFSSSFQAQLRVRRISAVRMQQSDC